MHINAHLEFDVVALQQHDTVTAMVELEAPQINPSDDSAARVGHSAVVVLDRSGSMSGTRLESAKGSLIQLVDRLDDRDRFGLIAFDHEATLVVPAQTVGETGKDHLRRAIASVYAGGSTDLASGYLRGLQEARRVANGSGATLVLLSDGHANTGIVDPAQLRGIAAKAASESITTSTIGIGTGYDEEILAEVATGGTGNHAFAEGPDQAAAAITAEFDGLLSKSVQGASLLITPEPQVTQIHVLNDLPTHIVDGSLLTDVGDLYSGERRRVVVAFDVPAMAELGMVDVGTLTFSYTELPGLKQHNVKIPVTVNVVPTDVAAGRVPRPEVTQEKLLLSSQSHKKAAEEAMRRGDNDTAYDILAAPIMAFDDLEADFGGTMDQRIKAEKEWLQRSRDLMGKTSNEYMTKRLRADRTRKSRGYDRDQGGEVDGDA